MELKIAGHGLRLPGVLLGLATIAVLTGCASDARPRVKVRIPAATVSPSATPTPPPPPQSWFTNAILLAIYGRGYGAADAPLLGRLAMNNNAADMHRQVQPFKAAIHRIDPRRQIHVAIDLIYGMAVPCSQSRNCLYYLDDSGENIVKRYIEPAARNHWLVILDDQLGRSNPAREVHRMIAKGYLKYDNVEVGIDPEFHVWPGETEPGYIFGSVTSYGLNHAQREVNTYASSRHLAHRKIFLVHEFKESMIQTRWKLRRRWTYVDPVIDADGLGPPGVKAETYHTLLGRQNKFGVKYRGLKLFLPNPFITTGGGVDNPVMQWKQALGHTPAEVGGQKFWIQPPPNIVIIA